MVAMGAGLLHRRDRDRLALGAGLLARRDIVADEDNNEIVEDLEDNRMVRAID
jgi:hypothetical protein